MQNIDLGKDLEKDYLEKATGREKEQDTEFDKMKFKYERKGNWIISKSAKQHRFFHSAGFSHTHIDGRPSKHAFSKVEKRRLQRKLRSKI